MQECPKKRRAVSVLAKGAAGVLGAAAGVGAAPRQAVPSALSGALRAGGWGRGRGGGGGGGRAWTRCVGRFLLLVFCVLFVLFFLFRRGLFWLLVMFIIVMTVQSLVFFCLIFCLGGGSHNRKI